MAIRLKDRDLQKRLDALCNDSDASFSTMLQGAAVGPRFHVAFGKGRCFRVTLDAEQIEPVPVFDPNGWNNSDDIVPPEDVPFMIEFWRIDNPCTPDETRKCLSKCYGYYEHGTWHGNTTDNVSEANQIRFKVWA